MISKIYLWETRSNCEMCSIGVSTDQNLEQPSGKHQISYHKSALPIASRFSNIEHFENYMFELPLHALGLRLKQQ